MNARGRPSAPDGALEVWRAQRTCQAADAVERDTASALATYDAPALNARFHEAWLERAAARDDSVTTGWLAATLDKRITVRAGNDIDGRTSLTRMRDRLRALERRCPDPRIGAAVIRFMESEPILPTTQQDDKSFAPLLRVLEAAGDPRQRGPLAALVERTRQRVLGCKSVPLRKLEKRAATHWLVTGAGHVDAALVRVSVANDLAAERSVSGGEAEQVRRELGSLDASPANAKRAASLLRKHKGDLLGAELAIVLTNVELERGMLVRAALANPAVAAGSTWALAMQAESLGTLRRLDRGSGSVARFGEFLAAPSLVNLQEIVVDRHEELEPLLATERATAVRSLRFWRHPPDLAFLERIAASPVFARLESLHARGGVHLLDDVFATSLGRRLTSITVAPTTTDDGSGVFGRWRHLPATLQRLQVADLAVCRTHGGIVVELNAERGKRASPDELILLRELDVDPLAVRLRVHRFDPDVVRKFKAFAKKRGIAFEVEWIEA